MIPLPRLPLSPHLCSGPLDARQRLEFLHFHLDRHRAQIDALMKVPDLPHPVHL